MKKIALLFSIVVLACGTCLAQTTSFTYQGKLGDAGAPANGSYDFQFKLFDQPTGGTQQGSTLPSTGVTVANGGFTVQLDFGANFPGGASGDRYLETSVRVHNADPNTPVYSTLSPRQQIGSTPYAIRSLSAATADNVSGIVSIANGGTGGATQNFVDLNSNQAIGGNKTFTGMLSGDGSGLTNIHASFAWKVIANNNFQTAVPNTGYVVTNSRQVTITLPEVPNIGDVIRVSSAAEGGWKIVQNPGQTILRPDADLPLQWTPHESNRQWQSVASSADGTKLVAVSSGVGNAPGGDKIYTSTDSGATWTPRETNRNWRSVASSADGAKLIAVAAAGGGGLIYTSTDSGAIWTPRESPRNWRAVASSADGSNLVALASPGFIYMSTDSGVTWAPRETSRAWISVVSSADGTKLAATAVIGGPNNQIFTSVDSGITWVPRESGLEWVSLASSADGTQLVGLVGGGQIYISVDSGVTFTPRENARNWRAVASSGDGIKLVAIVAGGQIYASTDSGATWISRESNRDWQAVASSENGTKLVAVVGGSCDGCAGRIYTTEGTAITTTVGPGGYLSGGYLSAIELQYVGGGRFIWLSHEGVISTF